MNASEQVYGGRVHRIATGGEHRNPDAPKPAQAAAKLSAEARQVWRHLRDHGGWWTPAEVGAAFRPQGANNRAATTAGRWLMALNKRGHVAKNPLDAKVASYGVTARCKPIPGESLDPLNDSSERLL